jgi:23S rRNA U2552 (ribose-2'-O)-methylase RlmE/FtsJ
MRRNDDIHRELEEFKDGITKHYRNRKWDRFKKHCNEYELIFTSTPDYPSISQLSPISRSFFKLWETMRDFRDLFYFPPTAMRAAFICEGPGGFVEAFCKMREKVNDDELFGMTLLSSNKNVPDWKLGKNELKGKHITLLAGEDGTGDVYNRSNVDAFVAAVGPASIDFITADGGFDFSGNFSQQEQLSLKLIASEVYAACRSQRVGGTFFLKVYDLRLECTLQVLSVLVNSYDEVHVTKPLSSRPANSEKYLICSKFRGTSEEDLSKLCVFMDDNSLPNNSTNRLCLESLVDINRYFVDLQVKSIDGTLKYICKYDVASEKERKDMMTASANAQIGKSHAWCVDYNVGVSAVAVNKYRLQ